MATYQLFPCFLLLILNIKPMFGSLFQFGDMITCATGRSQFDYNPYGCWCGMGGDGEPVDNIDRCCMEHDHCYREIRLGLNCRTKTDNYEWQCGLRNLNPNTSAVICDNDANQRCEKLICGCDLAAVQCFAKYDSEYPKSRKPECPIPKSPTRNVVDTLTTFMRSIFG